MTDHEKSLGMPTGLSIGLVTLVLLILLAVMFYFLTQPLLKLFF